jgi:glycosyltransferase involved in cell wall biosynthesis
MSYKALYKIFDYCWHMPHQFDMINALRDHCRFDYCLNNRKHWDRSQRPIPDGLKFVLHYERGLYDFAIFHIDQRIYFSDDQQLKIYKELNDYIDDIPKIVINHGSPVFPEAFEQLNPLPPVQEMESTVISFVRSLIGTNTMVVNSHTASSDKEWGFGKPIIHGLDPNDWWDLPKELRVFTALPVQDLATYYNRECLKATGELLFYQYGYLLKVAKYNAPAFKSFDNYRNYLGRSLVYLDTSTRTPMNRARTEAFLSGCCVVQVEGAHDIDRWAKNGENMILVPNDPNRIAALIADLLGNRYEEALQIGQNGKKMAAALFNQERYRNDWLDLFKSLKSL